MVVVIGIDTDARNGVEVEVLYRQVAIVDRQLEPLVQRHRDACACLERETRVVVVDPGG
jgi:hypothetical protein